MLPMTCLSLCYPKDTSGHIVTDSKKTKERWKKYIEILCSRDVNIKYILEDIPYSHVSLVLENELR